jgi:hypothetical protein
MTTQASKDAAIYQVTEWAPPRSHILTTGGLIHYELWLQMEVDRNKELWTTTWVERDKDTGDIALFTWAGWQKPVEGEDPKE